jgi:ribosomal protein S27E
MVRTACTECGEPLMLDGPVRSIRCLACQSMVEIGASNWKRVLEYRPDGKAKNRVAPCVIGFASELTFNIKMGPQAPKCVACDKPVDLALVTPGMDGEIPCACGHSMSTFPAPSWLHEAVPKATQLFNAEREDSAAKAPVTPQADRPVSIACPDCGAYVKVTSESARIVECKFCKTALYLPADLWRTLHPVRKRGTWYVAFA